MENRIYAEIAGLQGLIGPELRKRYFEVWGERPRASDHHHLVRRIAWQLQAAVLGDIPERARARALELAGVSELKDQLPFSLADYDSFTSRKRRKADKRLPPPGTELTRRYRGRIIVATMLVNGVEYQGQRYKSLSAVARAVTGTRWNGLLFFGLAKRGETIPGKRRKRKAAVGS